MPRGGSRVGAGRPKHGSKPKVTVQTMNSDQTTDLDRVKVLPESDVVEVRLQPLEYMLKVMNDPGIDELRRDRMAVAAAPYLHPKIGEGGKKDQKERAAKTAGVGKFAPTAPPKLVVNNK